MGKDQVDKLELLDDGLITLRIYRMESRDFRSSEMMEDRCLAHVRKAGNKKKRRNRILQTS